MSSYTRKIGRWLTVEYKTDRDIPETIWNNYMRVFDNKYKVYKDEASVYHLKCKYGSVYLHSMLRHELSAVLNFKSMQGVNKTILALRELAPSSWVSQEGEGDVVIVFNEVDLDKVAGYLRVRYKRQYTPEQKEALRRRFHKIYPATQGISTQPINVNRFDGQEG